MDDTTTFAERPADRFAGPDHLLDLPALAAALRAEPAPARNGHRQRTIFHRDRLTLLLFAFEPGGCLADHQADGVVTIHLIDGGVTVTAGSTNYVLSPGQVVALAPGVSHSVTAAAASVLLVSVALLAQGEPNG